MSATTTPKGRPAMIGGIALGVLSGLPVIAARGDLRVLHASSVRD